MKKKIGTRIIVMLLAMTVMYLISTVASTYAQEQALGGMNRIYNSWTQLERMETRLVQVVDENELHLKNSLPYRRDQLKCRRNNCGHYGEPCNCKGQSESD